MQSMNENTKNVLPDFLSNLNIPKNVFPSIHYIIPDASNLQKDSQAIY